MIALDTNIIVRFLVADDDNQFKQVLALLHRLENDKQCASVSCLVLMEMSWVLAHFYKISREKIIDNILILCNMPSLQVEHSQIIITTLEQAKQNTFDLADLLIAIHYSVGNNAPIMTFDKKAAKYQLFELLV